MNAKMAVRTNSEHGSIWLIVLGYLVVATVFIGLIFAVLSYGDQLTTTASAGEVTAKVAAPHGLSPLYHVLLASFPFCCSGDGWGSCSCTWDSHE